MTTTVTIEPSDAFPRRLAISWSANAVTLGVYLPQRHRESPGVRIVFTVASRGADSDHRVYLIVGGAGCALWVCGTAFELAPDDASAIRAALEPLGLVVEVSP